MTTVSYSEVQTFLKCRRAHWYGYVKNLERNETSESLSIGKALHAALETYYSYFVGTAYSAPLHLTAVEEALQVWDANAPDSDSLDKRADLRASLVLYFQDEPYVSKRYTIIAVEKEYALNWDTERDLHYPFVVDLLMEDPFGELMVVDHKTGYEFIADGVMEHLQAQLPLYIGALRALGLPVVYGEYNQFRTRKIKAPTKEQLLRQHPVRQSMTLPRIKQTFTEHAYASMDIQAVKASPDANRAYRVANKMVCQSCAFVNLCTADLLGQGSDLVEKTQFHQRERRVFTTTGEAA